MCGIAGVIAWDERYRVTREQLERMSAAIAHRGPDGEGMWIGERNSAACGLAHRRLAIIDPDPRANQPFADAQARQLVYNGEIYNFRELRAELSKIRPDYAWRTKCDTVRKWLPRASVRRKQRSWKRTRSAGCHCG